MVLVTGNWRVALAGLVASLVIFAVLFFTVIQPSQNTANQAVKTGLQQSQQALNQAQKQLSNAASQTGSSASGSSAAGAASATVSKAAKLAGCLASAGTDVSKVQACQTQYGS
jgi:predicted PurR-regulated permease PerM